MMLTQAAILGPTRYHFDMTEGQLLLSAQKFANHHWSFMLLYILGKTMGTKYRGMRSLLSYFKKQMGGCDGPPVLNERDDVFVFSLSLVATPQQHSSTEREREKREREREEERERRERQDSKSSFFVFSSFVLKILKHDSMISDYRERTQL
jgi:hypothetical protein